MIEDRITKGLKAAISNSIGRTEDTNKEQGFFICSNKDETLAPSRIRCEGEACQIKIKRSPRPCKGEIQGFFHTHPQKLDFEKKIGMKVTDDERKNLTFADRKGVRGTAQTPSYSDVLTIFITKCEKYTNGTICTAGDLEPEKVGCWTAKKDSTNHMNCARARIDYMFKRQLEDSPKKWIRSLFDTEIINLK